MKKFFSVLLFVFLSAYCFTQPTEADQIKIREVSLNMTGLFSQFVPFSNSNGRTGPFDVTWLSGKNNRFFRISLGANISSLDDNINPHLDLAVGYTRRLNIYKRFYYDRSFLFMAYVGSLNLPTAPQMDEAAVGLAFGFAPGYEINKNLRLSTEMLLFTGIGSTFNLLFVPPIALNLSLRFGLRKDQ